jgi:hypothetical protein
MKKLNELGVKIWLRYVDDVFAIIEHESQSDVILDYLNKQHTNIKFTIESEKHNKLPFLDTKITRKQNEFTTTIYHKPTFTGVYLNWTSLTSRKYKVSLIYCLCDRIWKICKDQQDRDLEIKKLKQILAKNEYPDHIINKEVDKFIKNRTTREQQQTPQAQQATVEKQKKYIVLPYSNNKMDAFADRLTKLVNETFDVELRVAFKAPNEIGKLFPFKDNIKETYAHSMVVYKITCDTCNQAYIGKTKRILIHRIKEHDNEAKDSAIQTHRKEFPTHTINPYNIEIIDRADTNYKVELKEALHINTKKPELNIQHAAAYKRKNKKDPFKKNLRTLIIAQHS